MIEARDRPRLPDEALGEDRVLLDDVPHHLDGDRAVEVLVEASPDARHAAFGDLRIQAITSELHGHCDSNPVDSLFRLTHRFRTDPRLFRGMKQWAGRRNL